MQTFNKTNSQIELLAPAKKPATNSKKDDNDEFLNMVLNAASSRAKQGETISEKDVKEIAKSVNMQNQSELKTQEEASIKIADDLATKLDEATKNELYENANFMQLLQVLEILNGGEQVSKYPNFSDKIAAFLSNAQNVAELSEVKSISELLDLAKKFDLGLEKITISETDVKNLNEMFKNLGKNEFFTPVLPPKPQLLSSELKNQVEHVINQAPKEPKIGLNELLKEVAKEKPITTQNTTTTPQNTDDETNTDDGVTQNLIKQPAQQTLPDEAEPEIKQATQNTQNFTQNEGKKEQKINLQSLLYPEREQNLSDETSQNSEQNSNNELNSMVKDVVKNAQSQIQNRVAVRETLSNFSQTLAEQVANYKAPFTRVNITLNPLNLGEVEVTMLNRGNNLHINFSSTTTTMNLFLQNQAEFKSNLVNMGFTQLEMNFSDQNQKKEQGQKAYKNNAQDENFTENDEQVLLELVIPRYI
ncbi:flagellar hook-length control protein FliK [Campylobacter gastrosuis]|uniref:Flagellar hook-length control protein FliK n=1 Tax=Campylobacter gastrosuis TaxID=2974576 RepID=A0ABT7HSD2_9BACT|nr:flagellar hook-length control protein FliK [Campylobacter gastrosuis]MDL0089775.1 flagellar hook-length control protein FliK [Campylobacter gastrosuis]